LYRGSSDFNTFLHLFACTAMISAFLLLTGCSLTLVVVNPQTLYGHLYGLCNLAEMPFFGSGLCK